MKVLLHTCCGPCASACIPRLKDEGCAVALFYSNSNIDSKEEFEKRCEAASKLAAADGVEMAVDEYNHDDWLKKVAEGLESEPEKGARCRKCFEYNLRRTATYAKENGFDAWATSLTVSPHKPSKVIFGVGDLIDETTFLKVDFKKKEGFKLSVKRAAELGLYRQDYCGCEFSKRARDADN